jgi:hypothetical protein
MISAKVQRKGNAAEVLERIRAAISGPSTVKVGFPKGAADPDETQKAIWNEFGHAGSGKGFKTARGGGFGGPVPERPFMRNGMADGKPEFQALMRHDAKQILKGERTMRSTLDRLGNKGVGVIQASIQSGDFAPNSPLTIELKGSSRPLIDKSSMVQAVTFLVGD